MTEHTLNCEYGLKPGDEHLVLANTTTFVPGWARVFPGLVRSVIWVAVFPGHRGDNDAVTHVISWRVNPLKWLDEVSMGGHAVMTVSRQLGKLGRSRALRYG